jgi:hypothetical protein
MTEEIPDLDAPLTPEEQAEVELLNETEIEEIDRALLSNIICHWRKVAMVVGITMSPAMSNYPNSIPIVQDVFYFSRIHKLAKKDNLNCREIWDVCVLAK